MRVRRDVDGVIGVRQRDREDGDSVGRVARRYASRDAGSDARRFGQDRVGRQQEFSVIGRLIGRFVGRVIRRRIGCVGRRLVDIRNRLDRLDRPEG